MTCPCATFWFEAAVFEAAVFATSRCVPAGS